MNRGKTKIGQVFYPDNKHWNELRKYVNISDVIFVPITYKPCHPWSVNGKKLHKGKAKSNIKNWRDHNGLLVKKEEKWVYCDSQFYAGVAINKHYAYQAVFTSLRRKIDQVLNRKSVGISAHKFSQSFG